MFKLLYSYTGLGQGLGGAAMGMPDIFPGEADTGPVGDGDGTHNSDDER